MPGMEYLLLIYLALGVAFVGPLVVHEHRTLRAWDPMAVWACIALVFVWPVLVLFYLVVLVIGRDRG